MPSAPRFRASAIVSARFAWRSGESASGREPGEHEPGEPLGCATRSGHRA